MGTHSSQPTSNTENIFINVIKLLVFPLGETTQPVKGE
jgi:hypothetical protein